MDLGSLESCLHAIDDEINALESSAHALKFHRNTLVPISRLPTEILSIIFSLLPSSSAPSPISHVCHRWREISLNLPNLWTHVDFTKLTPTGAAEVLARAKMAPLHLEAQTEEWGVEKFEAFKGQIEAHIHHTRHLNITTTAQHLLKTLLVSSAPSLERFSITIISQSIISPIIPDNLFDGIAPKLIYLRLDNCAIRWQSPLLKGLRDLKLVSFPTYARTPLNTWLDALKQMPQLERLSFNGGVPFHWLASRPVEPMLTVVLSSLTELDISASAGNCLAAVGHFLLPALTRLCLNAQTYRDRNMLSLIPYVARNAHGPQDTEPLRSLFVGVNRTQAEILAWTMPRQETDDGLRGSVDIPDGIRFPRMAFGITTKRNWHTGMPIPVPNAVLTGLPLNSITSLTVKGRAPLSKHAWLSIAQRWHKLERVRLFFTTVPAFREMIEEPQPRGGLLLPSLEELVLINVSLNAQRVCYLCDMLIQLVELGVPLRTLDLRTCIATNRAVQLFSEIVVNVQGPVEREAGDLYGKRRGNIEVLGEEGGRNEEDEEEDESDGVLGSWDTDNSETDSELGSHS